MKILLSILFIFSAECAAAQHILVSDSAFGRPNDTVAVSMEIENATPFISFQFDLQLPSGATFIGYSIKLTARSTNHVAIGNLVDNNTIRILAYSPDNDAFTGNTGKVLSFKLALGNVRGEFPLTLTNAVIGDSLSRNILSGSRIGILSVFPVSIGEHMNNIAPPGFNIFPNPVRDFSTMEFSLKSLSRVEISLYDTRGRKLFSEPAGEFGEGNHQYRIPGPLYTLMIPGIPYVLAIYFYSRGQTPVAVYKKIVK